MVTHPLQAPELDTLTPPLTRSTRWAPLRPSPAVLPSPPQCAWPGEAGFGRVSSVVPPPLSRVRPWQMSGSPTNPIQLCPSFSPGPQQKEETRLRVQVSDEGGQESEEGLWGGALWEGEIPGPSSGGRRPGLSGPGPWTPPAFPRQRPETPPLRPLYFGLETALSCNAPGARRMTRGQHRQLHQLPLEILQTLWASVHSV